jgi:hypothetical protein
MKQAETRFPYEKPLTVADQGLRIRLLGGARGIRTLDEALHPILP